MTEKTPDYTVDYEDKRFQTVEAEEKAALKDNKQTYRGMIQDSKSYFDNQISETERWGEEQKQLQQEQTDFTIEGINQQKDWAEKDYKKEQSGAYADWQKQSNKYGANAEAMAAQGMGGTGYSESSQVQMYNTYQNRVATARESFVRATAEYDNMIKEAKLQNSAALAQIAHDTLAKKLELSLSAFQYKNTLVLEEARTKREIEQMYHQRWQDVLNQINTENTLAENVRQYDLSYELEKKKYEDSLKPKGNVGGGGGGSTKFKGSNRGSSGSSIIKEIERRTGKTTPSSSPEVDMKNIIDLGYGPISEKRLDELMATGAVVGQVRNGKWHFQRNDKG